MQLPKITVSANTKLSVRRFLPAPGEVLVQSGQRVEALTPVARTEMASRYQVIDIARQLGQPQPDMDEVMQIGEGDIVTVNQVIAAYKGKVPFLRRSVRAPAAGRVAKIGPGWVLLETERTTVEIEAFISGTVTRILGSQGAVIETEGALIEAACGFGGEAFGRLKRLANSPYEVLEPAAFDESASDSIILGGRTLDESLLRKAEEWRVRGIIVGSLPAALLRLDPPSKVRVVATEGFGEGPMSPHTFGVLTSLSRRELSIRGTTPHLTPGTGVYPAEEPPIILAAGSVRSGSGNYTSSAAAAKPPAKLDATLGSRVRVTRGKLLGASGVIETIPLEPQFTPSGLVAPGANIKFNSDTLFIPWANLELIE
jgi:hypothetical protein